MMATSMPSTSAASSMAIGDSVDDVADENRVTLNDLLRSPVVRFTYTYDFGDNWEHTVAFEKSEAAVEGAVLPRLRRWKAELSTRGLRRCLGLSGVAGNSWPIPPTPNAPNGSIGSTKSSTRTSSI